MKITVWVVSTCIPENTEPCWPMPFGTEPEAEAHAEAQMREEWEVNGPRDSETDELLPYPGDWREAQDRIIAYRNATGSEDDDKWGQWQITQHEIEVGTSPFPALEDAIGELAEAAAAHQSPLKPLEWEGDEDGGPDEAGEYEAPCIFGEYRLVGSGESFNLLLSYVAGQHLYQTLVAEGVTLDEGKEIAAVNYTSRMAEVFA